MVLGIDEGEAQPAAVWRPPQPEGTALQSGEFASTGAILLGDNQIASTGDQDVLAVGHPGSVVTQRIRQPPGSTADGGNDPQGLLRVRREVVADQEFGSVLRNVSQRRRGNLQGQRNKAALAIDNQCLGKGAATILDLEEKEARTIGGAAGQALE